MESKSKYYLQPGAKAAGRRAIAGPPLWGSDFAEVGARPVLWVGLAGIKHAITSVRSLPRGPEIALGFIKAGGAMVPHVFLMKPTLSASPVVTNSNGLSG